MAGTLTISTLSDGTNSTSATNCIQGSAKVWINFNGVTSAIRGSYNVGSITKNGTGDYTLNFTNALADANYSPVFGYAQSFAAGGYKVGVLTAVSEVGTPTLMSTTQLRIMSGVPSALDFTNIYCAIFR